VDFPVRDRDGGRGEQRMAILRTSGELDGETNHGVVELAEEDGEWRVALQSRTAVKARTGSTVADWGRAPARDISRPREDTMKRRLRRALAVVLALGLCSAALAANDPKKLESTPQVKSYRALLAAMKAGDYDAYKKHMMKAAGPQMDEQAKQMGKSPKDVLSFMTMMTPTDIAVSDMKVDGKKATLHASGKLEGEMNYGTIEMAEEDGQWKVGQQSWANHK